MKKTLLFFFALTVFSGVALARRLDEPAALARMAVVRSGSTFKVFYKGTSVNKVTVNIYNANGTLVLSDNLGKLDNFVRPYNFTGLAEGKYTIELIDQAGKQIEHVEYKEGKIEKLASLIKVATEESKYLLMVPSSGQDVIQVKILDESANVVYNEVEHVAGNFAKVYDLKAIPGKFSFEITDKKGITKTIRY